MKAIKDAKINMVMNQKKRPSVMRLNTIKIDLYKFIFFVL